MVVQPRLRTQRGLTDDRCLRTFRMLTLVFLSISTLLPTTATAMQPVVQINNGHAGDKGSTHIEAAIEIDAPAEIIWQIMVDCDQAQSIVPHLTSCEILQRGDSGDGKTSWDVRRHKIKYGALFPSTKNQFKSVYNRQRSIHFEKAGGDLKHLKGVWRLEENGTLVRVTYRAEINIGKPVPKFLVRRAVRKDTMEILQRLRKRAETLHHSNIVDTNI